MNGKGRESKSVFLGMSEDGSDFISAPKGVSFVTVLDFRQEFTMGPAHPAVGFAEHGEFRQVYQLESKARLFTCLRHWPGREFAVLPFVEEDSRG